ncbi:uncharacterized protein LOC109847320 [Asparagus officinalis]|uniref:uncharacterized protein LOC109847320 n=1 Tax=Asparagus officinalis TaxID=4686 RepID=UPI00098E0864|nr:uncharacterized protein LOC109847320 [Asparagus officinalis]
MREVPDKSWIDIPIMKRREGGDTRYREGWEAFLEYAYANPRKLENDLLFCPCSFCRNRGLVDRVTIQKHLERWGFDEKYKYWRFHGEDDDIEPADGNINLRIDDTHAMFNDIAAVTEVAEFPEVLEVPEDAEGVENVDDVRDTDSFKSLMKLLEDDEKDLYAGCSEYSRLSFILQLMRIKTLSGMADKYFQMLLNLLRKVIPDGENSIPEKCYDANKIVGALGLDYTKIHACPNDCILYYKDNEKLEECPKCGVSRWRKNTRTSTRKADEPVKQPKKIPAKVLRHFPLVPRLQRLYMTKDTAKNMRWHKEGRVVDGKLRHPADADAWEHVDQSFPWFSTECRNVRLGLSSDGFNPFGIMSSGWSTWPIVLIPYNLPPGLCMKQPYMILSLLIPGKHSPGNDIDVFMEPLIDELKLLWDEGVQTYDAFSRQTFNLRAILMWTINDFPAYANLSGWSTKGTFACPVCGPNFEGFHLQHSRKMCYWFNRRWLRKGHKYRGKRWANKFDGQEEKRGEPHVMTGDEIVELFEGYPKNKFGKSRYTREDILAPRRISIMKKAPKRKRKVCITDETRDEELPKGWTKFSIFFQLPYWQKLKIRHNLDVMHIEKNICDNLLSTLLQDGKKSKDDLRARRDLNALNIRHDLQAREVTEGKFELPSSRITMTKVEMQRFCEVLKSVKSPDGYCSNISNNVQVKERKILGLKTHDYHILLHQLLPVALRNNMADDEVAKVIIEFCGFFRKLCSKVINVTEFKTLKGEMNETLCKMELFFPPSFFTIMVHLTHHLVDEALLGGPVNYRWMYPMERYLGFLKRIMRNRAHPEGSIADHYVANECMSFASRYMRGGDANNNTQISKRDATFHGSTKMNKDYSRIDLEQAHAFELQLEITGPSARNQIAKIHEKKFSEWVSAEVERQIFAGLPISEEIRIHAHGPHYTVKQCSGYRVNGFLFQKLGIEEERVTQNSGVMAIFSQECYASSTDQNPILNDLIYYGQLEDILEMFYAYGTKDVRSYVMFKVRWCHAEITRDAYGFNLVNLDKEIYSDLKFMFAKQATQCFYVKDPRQPKVWVALYKEPRTLVELSLDENIEGSDDPNETEGEVFPNYSYPQNVNFNMYTPQNRLDIRNVGD